MYYFMFSNRYSAVIWSNMTHMNTNACTEYHAMSDSTFEIVSNAKRLNQLQSTHKRWLAVLRINGETTHNQCWLVYSDDMNDCDKVQTYIHTTNTLLSCTYMRHVFLLFTFFCNQQNLMGVLMYILCCSNEHFALF
jgi:hypothetical protein